MKHYRHVDWSTLGMIRMENDRLDIHHAAWVHTWTMAYIARKRSRERWLDNITEDCEDLNLTIH